MNKHFLVFSVIVLLFSIFLFIYLWNNSLSYQTYWGNEFYSKDFWLHPDNENVFNTDITYEIVDGRLKSVNFTEEFFEVTNSNCTDCSLKFNFSHIDQNSTAIQTLNNDLLPILTNFESFKKLLQKDNELFLNIKFRLNDIGNINSVTSILFYKL